MFVFYLKCPTRRNAVFVFALSRTHRACTWGLAQASAYFSARSLQKTAVETRLHCRARVPIFFFSFFPLLFFALIPCCRYVVTRFPLFFVFCLCLAAVSSMVVRFRQPLSFSWLIFFFLFLFGSPLASLPFRRSRPRKELKQQKKEEKNQASPVVSPPLTSKALAFSCARVAMISPPLPPLPTTSLSHFFSSIFHTLFFSFFGFLRGVVVVGSGARTQQAFGSLGRRNGSWWLS